MEGVNLRNKTNLEKETCNICNSIRSRYLFNNRDKLHGFSGDFKINRCLDCGLVYISPRPDDINKYYVDDYEPYQVSQQDFYQKLDSNLAEAYFSKKRGIISRFKAIFYKLFNNPIPLEYTGKRILDLGCGSGQFIYNLREFGKFDVYGVDFSEYAIKQAKSRGLENVFTGSLIQQNFSDNLFDIITLNHVIEHLPNPIETMIEIKRILKSDGLVIITTPNTDSVLFKVLKSNWFALETPRHLNLFSRKTLFKMVDLVGGLEIENVNYKISNYVFAKSLIYFFKIKNKFLANILMKGKILFSPFFYLMPGGKRDFITVYIKIN